MEMPPMIPANGAGSHFASCCFSLFFPGIISERSVVFHRNPGSAAALASKKQQKTPLFGRCFSLFSCERTAKITAPAREIHFE
jgi:hypothetical protein